MGVRAHLVDFSSMTYSFSSSTAASASSSASASGSSSSLGRAGGGGDRSPSEVVDIIDRDSDGGHSDGGSAEPDNNDDDDFIEDEWKEACCKRGAKATSGKCGEIGGDNIAEASSGGSGNVSNGQLERRSARKRKRPLTYAGHTARQQTNKHSNEDCLLYSWVEKYYEEAQLGSALSRWVQDGEEWPSRCVCGECGEGAGAERCVFVPPLYFQHQGHSRTLVGE
jgi:hypothetical protein